jgi:hypothetical protein
VPGTTWTVAQTGAHLVGIVMRGTGDRRRAATIETLGELNQIQIDEIGESDPAVIADLLEERLARQLSLLPNATGEEPFELHAGIYATVKTALSYELWDFVLHGYDIARATGRSWVIEPDEAALDVVAVLPPLEPWLRPEIRAGASRRVAFTLAELGLTVLVQAGGGEYDVTVVDNMSAEVVDPVDLLLALGQRRTSQHSLIAELASFYLPT